VIATTPSKSSTRSAYVLTQQLFQTGISPQYTTLLERERREREREKRERERREREKRERKEREKREEKRK
jgi:hypothetical protein